MEELECDCGNPVCHAKAFFRRGFVFFTSPDGTQSSRNDYFYLDAFDWDEKRGESRNIELMVQPDQAKELMWYLIFSFMPGVSHLHRCALRLWVRFPRYWYWSTADWWKERFKSSGKST